MIFFKNSFLFRKVSKYIDRELSEITDAPLQAPKCRKFIDIMALKDDEESIDHFIKDNYSDMSFSNMLTFYMHQRDITTSMIYKRCFIDRKLISKITSSDNYHPSKQTVFALCVALRLNLRESEKFLALAGYTFNHHQKYDLIIKFMLDNQIYNIDTINNILFKFGESCFGE